MVVLDRDEVVVLNMGYNKVCKVLIHFLKATLKLSLKAVLEKVIEQSLRLVSGTSLVKNSSPTRKVVVVLVCEFLVKKDRDSMIIFHGGFADTRHLPQNPRALSPVFSRPEET